MMDRLAFDCELKLAGVDGADAGTIEGYASVYNVVDRGGDIVLPGAFKASLADWRKRKAAVPMLWYHDAGTPIGLWTDLNEDDHGLKAAGVFIDGVPQAAIARAVVKAGAVKGLSIGYRTIDYEIDRTTGVRKIKKAELWEISLVTFPMNVDAQITGAKAAFDDRLLEQAFRDEGLSNREAKLAVSVVRKQVLRDGGRSEQTSRDGKTDLLMALRKSAELLRS